jgi:hypothetical protein
MGQTCCRLEQAVSSLGIILQRQHNLLAREDAPVVLNHCCPAGEEDEPFPESDGGERCAENEENASPPLSSDRSAEAEAGEHLFPVVEAAVPQQQRPGFFRRAKDAVCGFFRGIWNFVREKLRPQH